MAVATNTTRRGNAQCATHRSHWHTLAAYCLCHVCVSGAAPCSNNRSTCVNTTRAHTHTLRTNKTQQTSNDDPGTRGNLRGGAAGEHVARAPARAAARQTGPPDALALFRVVVARERRVGDGGGDVLETRFPTKAGDAAAAAAAAAGGAAEASAFWAGVPPFVWATEFAGERWECAEGADVPDAEPELVAAPLSVGLRWHERVADEGIWSLRLPGNRAIVQCARAVKPGEPAPLRVAWLPRHDDAGVEMLRAEAVVVALAGVASDDDDALVRIAPPRLIDLRGDAFRRDEDAHAAAQAAREGAASPEGFDDLLGSL